MSELSLPPSEGTGEWISRYFKDVWEIISRPAAFFRRFSQQRPSTAYALTFALVTHWLGKALQSLWAFSMLHSFESWAGRLFQWGNRWDLEISHPGRAAELLEWRDRVWHWFVGAGSVILDPFFTLLSILFTSLLVLVGVKLLVPRNAPRADYSSTVQLICFGLTPSILSAIPFIGPFAAALGIVIVTTIGAREWYQVSTGRAVAIAIFPKLLFFGFLLIGLMGILFIFLKLFSALFA